MRQTARPYFPTAARAVLLLNLNLKPKHLVHWLKVDKPKSFGKTRVLTAQRI